MDNQAPLKKVFDDWDESYLRLILWIILEEYGGEVWV
jgi:hypothetical protein